MPLPSPLRESLVLCNIKHIHDLQERPWILASGLCQCDVWKVWQLLLKVKILRSLLLFVRRYVTTGN